MARNVHDRDIAPALTAAERWIQACLIEDGSLFSNSQLWTAKLIDEVHAAFVDHPDFGKEDFMTKLKGQMKAASAPAQQLMAEMLWALLLFPSNMKARTKRQQVQDLWALTGQRLGDEGPLLDDHVLVGIGSGGPGFNYWPDEMTFLIVLARDLKRHSPGERRHILTQYDKFMEWIESCPGRGVVNFVTCLGSLRFQIVSNESHPITTEEVSWRSLELRR